MSWRFRRRFRVAPGLWLNLSRSGISTTIGTRGLTYTIGRRGTGATVGLPGSGISYSTYRRYPHHVTAPRPARTLFWLVAGTIILLALGLTGQHQETYMRTFLIFALLLSLASPALARGHGGSHSHTSHHTHSSKR